MSQGVKHSLGNRVNNVAITLHGDRWHLACHCDHIQRWVGVQPLCCTPNANCVVCQLYFNKNIDFDVRNRASRLSSTICCHLPCQHSPCSARQKWNHRGAFFAGCVEPLHTTGNLQSSYRKLSMCDPDEYCSDISLLLDHICKVHFLSGPPFSSQELHGSS